MTRNIGFLVGHRAVWRSQQEALGPVDWTCGFCGQGVGEDQGWQAVDAEGYHLAAIRICRRCRCPTFFQVGQPPFPEPLPGEAIPHVPELVNGMYEEARACVRAGAHRSAALACRTTLMYIATQLNDGQRIDGGFQANITWLFDNHWIPPNGRAWVEHIRDKGNDATHEIMTPDPELARQLVDFLGILLRVVYDMPARLAPPLPPAIGAP